MKLCGGDSARKCPDLSKRPRGSISVFIQLLSEAKQSYATCIRLRDSNQGFH